jgi:hypothetical protein
MGGGIYSISNRTARATTAGYYTKTSSEIFSQREISGAMNPKGIAVRESRDSEEHPNSLAIIIALDVTGSMGAVPNHLVKDGLPHIVGTVIQNVMPDPQLLFLAIGDHECDDAPLQVGQFESSDELLDKWLTSVYLEGGGGGNSGESYLLAWYFAGYHTSIDCFEKRGQKGFLFTIGDEPTLKSVPGKVIKGIMGEGQYSDMPANVLLEKAREKYNVFHLHIAETAAGMRPETVAGWKQIMGDSLIVINNHQDVPKTIADTINKYYRASGEVAEVSAAPSGNTEVIL